MHADNRYLLRLAAKNMRRNAGRSLFIALSIVLSTATAVWILAFFDGMNAQIERTVVDGNVGFYQLQEKNYAATGDPFSPLPWDGRTESALEDIPLRSPEMVLDGFLTAPEGSAALQVLGVDFPAHARALGLHRHMVDGRWPQAGERGVVIGKDVADKFRFAAGDSLVLNFQDRQGQLRSELLPILGVYRKHGRSFERRHAYVDGDVVEEFLLGAADPRRLYHRIVLMPEGFEEGEGAALAAAGTTGTVLKTWKQLNSEMAVVLDFHHGMMRLFFLIVAITVTLTILTPVTMLWQERKDEIRMFSTIGVPRRIIRRLARYEAGLMALAAASAASLLLLALVGAQARTGVDFSFLGEGQVMERAGIELPRIVYPVLLPSQLAVTYGFVAAVVGVSYGWAVHLALRQAGRSA